MVFQKDSVVKPSATTTIALALALELNVAVGKHCDDSSDSDSWDDDERNDSFLGQFRSLIRLEEILYFLFLLF